MSAYHIVIDDMSLPAPHASNGQMWAFIADGVMGGRSTGAITREIIAGRPANRLHGDVSLENNGGFIQIALDLQPDGDALDFTAYDGIELDVIGNGETYNAHLRTGDVTRPWQSYRLSFAAPHQWTSARLPFAEFEPYRIGTPLDLTKLKRLGIVAIGRKF